MALAGGLLFCSEAKAQVSSSYDSGAKFGKYTTYSFLGWQRRSNDNISLEDQKVILESFKNEFERRGVEWVNDKGSAIIALHVVVDEKTAKAEYADHLHEYGYKAVWEEGMVDNQDSTIVVEAPEIAYRQGTLMVHMYDAATQELVWQAVVTDVIQKDNQLRAENITQHIAELMETYPVVGR